MQAKAWSSCKSSANKDETYLLHFTFHRRFGAVAHCPLSTTLLFSPPWSISKTSLFLFVCIYLFLLLFTRLWTSQRSRSDWSVPCWMLLVTSDTTERKSSSSAEWLHPSLHEPKSSDDTKQTSLKSKLTEPVHLSVFLRQQHRCPFSLYNTLISAFNPPPHQSFLSPSLSLSWSHVQHQHSNDFIYSMRTLRGRIKRT